MSGSLSRWLALRESADTAARSIDLTRAVAARLPTHRPVRIVDLGTGTGANVRYLAGHLPSQQQWLLVDVDPALLEEAHARAASLSDRSGTVLQIETRQLDLGMLDSFDVVIGRDLVTASALLDLVSDRWLNALSTECRSAGAAVLFSLTYNGQSRCDPAEPEDDTIRTLMNRHQTKSDKGFGSAAGPDAADFAERAFRSAGYQVQRAASDWTLTPDAHALQRELILGWANAAREIAPGDDSTIDDWLARRLAHVDAGRSRIVVGHDDLAAWLPTSL